jgi:hypothetical protein
LTQHLRALILLFGTYLPPPTSLSSAANIPASSRATRVPQELLTDALIEEIKTRCCFVGAALEAPSADVGSPATEADLDLPPHSDTAPSESEVSARDSIISSSHRGSSDFSTTSPSHGAAGERHLQALSSLYIRHSTATDIRMQVDPPPSSQTGTGRGTLIMPGWIRERAAEVLFEGGDVDECSVAELILDAILKVRLVFFTGPHPDYSPFRVPGTARPAQNHGILYLVCRRHAYAPWFHPEIAHRAHPRVVRRPLVTKTTNTTRPPSTTALRPLRIPTPAYEVHRDPEQPIPTNADDQYCQRQRWERTCVRPCHDSLGGGLARWVRSQFIHPFW